MFPEKNKGWGGGGAVPSKRALRGQEVGSKCRFEGAPGFPSTLNYRL